MALNGIFMIYYVIDSQRDGIVGDLGRELHIAG
jgi:hypothetical protein